MNARERARDLMTRMILTGAIGAHRDDVFEGIERAIIAAEEAKAKEERERCMAIIADLIAPAEGKEEIMKEIRARLES